MAAPLVALAANKYVEGLSIDDVERAWTITPGDREPYEVRTIVDVLRSEMPTDAHFTTGVLHDPDGNPVLRQPRLVKTDPRILAAVRERGYCVRHELWVADVDTPGHVAVTEVMLADAAERLSRVPTVGWYATRGGLRVLQPLQGWQRPEDYEASLPEWLSMLQGVLGDAWIVDRKCLDWTRQFRAPQVIRDGRAVAPLRRDYRLMRRIVPPPVVAAKPPKMADAPPVDESRLPTLEDRIRRAAAYLAKLPPAVAGAGGHNATYHAACVVVRDFALDVESAYSLLESEYNPRCEPPWSENELRHKVESASRAGGPIGRCVVTNDGSDVASEDEISEVLEAIGKAREAKEPSLTPEAVITSIPDGLTGAELVADKFYQAIVFYLANPKLDAVVADGLIDQLSSRTGVAKTAIRRAVAVKRGERQKKARDQQNDNTGGALDDILGQYSFVRSTTGRVFARRVNRYIPTDSDQFISKIAHEFRMRTKKVVSKDTIDKLMLATRGGELPVVVVPIRYGSAGNGIYVDLGDGTDRVVEILPGSVRVIESSPVAFYSPQTQEPLPVPLVPRSDDEALAAFSGYRELLAMDDDGFHTVLAWQVQAMRPASSYPCVLMKSPHGTGKTIRAMLLRRPVDPARPEVERFPHNLDDLAIVAENSHILVFDNLRRLHPTISDALCRLATGDGASKRALFTDRDLARFEATRPFVLTSISDAATEPDLLDRALTLQFSKPKRRLTEAQINDRFRGMHANVFGALCYAVSICLGRQGEVDVPNEIRLQGPCSFAAGLEGRLVPDGAVVRAFLEARQDAQDTARDDAFVSGFLAWMETVNKWEGSAAKLREALIGEALRRPAWVPEFPRGVRAKLDMFTEVIAAAGVKVSHAFNGRGKDRRAWIVIENAEAKTGSAETRSAEPAEGPPMDWVDLVDRVADGSPVGLVESDEAGCSAKPSSCEEKIDPIHPIHAIQPQGSSHDRGSGLADRPDPPDPDVLAPDEFKRLLAIHLITRGLSETFAPAPVDPAEAGLTPGVYAAVVRGVGPAERVMVDYFGPKGPDGHAVGMPNLAMRDQLLASAARHAGACQLVIRHDGQAGLWPMDLAVPPDTIGAS